VVGYPAHHRFESPRISDALDAAFYNAYGAVEPANRRTLLALDVSTPP
jgi:60 kDa SS-A/Ro ribonucleoprotein